MKWMITTAVGTIRKEKLKYLQETFALLMIITKVNQIYLKFSKPFEILFVSRGQSRVYSTHSVSQKLQICHLSKSTIHNLLQLQFIL